MLGSLQWLQLGIFMFKIINKNLPSPLLTIFNYNYEVHGHYNRESHLMLEEYMYITHVHHLYMLVLLYHVYGTRLIMFLNV